MLLSADGTLWQERLREPEPGAPTRRESKADMRARGLESPDRADAVIGAVVMSLPGFTGSIAMETLAGIQFGPPQGGRSLFDSEPVTFD